MNRFRRTVRSGLSISLSYFLMATYVQAETSYCFTHDLPKSIQNDKEFDQPMHYRSQEIGGQTVLLAIGEIKSGEAGRLTQAIARLGPVDEVWLHSPGGSAAEGPLMGRVFHEKGLITRLAKGAACVSACSYAFLGGVIRIVEPGAYYGIHMFTSTRDTEGMIDLMTYMSELAVKRQNLIKEKKYSQQDIDEVVADKVGKKLRSIEQESAQIAAIRARYLVEMSLSLSFMTDAFNQDANGVCYLSAAGLSRYNVSNSH